MQRRFLRRPPPLTSWSALHRRRTESPALLFVASHFPCRYTHHPPLPQRHGVAGQGPRRLRQHTAPPVTQLEWAEDTTSSQPAASAAAAVAPSTPSRDHQTTASTPSRESISPADHAAPRSSSSSNVQGQRRRRARPTTAADLLQSLEARQSPFASTMRKQLTPRHTGRHGAVADRHSAHQTDAQRRMDSELRADEAAAIKQGGYDPALVVRVDARRRQVRLNAVQREMVWTARRAQYQDLLLRIVTCLQSHRSPVEKCQTLFSLHDAAVRDRLRLRADTYEDIFHTLYSVGVQRGGGARQPGRDSLSPSAQHTSGDARWDGDVSGHDAAAVSGSSLPPELATPSAASSTVLSAHGIEHVWEMYRYCVDSGTNPTARVLQYVMGLLEHAAVTFAVSRSTTAPVMEQARTVSRTRSSALMLVEAKAHSLMMDADRFHLTPSEYTVNSYIGICEACDVMHLAVARVTDYQTRHERQAPSGMYARLITGLVRCGHYEDAMAVVTTMQNVAMSTYLLNAVLQAARHSRDPSSAFTFYRSMFFTSGHALRVAEARPGREPRTGVSARSGTRLTPSLVTFSILVEVMQNIGSTKELDFVLAEMRHYGVKGNGMVLNKLLKLMEEAGRSAKERQALVRAMEAKRVRVFDENKQSSPLIAAE